MAKNIDGQISRYLSIVHNSDNARIIRRYLRFVKNQTPKTQELKIYVITKMENTINKPFMDITREDLEDYTYGDTFLQGARGKLSDGTVHNYLVNIKSFFKALYCDFDKSKMKRTPYPDCVSLIDTETSNKTKLPEELLTEDEILSMLKECDNVRDQLMISLFYDTAGRISEVLDLDEDDIHTDSYGLYVIVNGKTGMRRIRLHVSEPYVHRYLQKPVKGKPLLSTANGRISESQTRRILRKWAEKASIEKRIHPHLFRHTKLTEMAKGMTDAQLRIYAGWENTSIMTGTYVHLSGADIDKKQLEMYGMAIDDVVEESPLKPVVCPHCGTRNTPLATFCYTCRGKIGEIPIDPEVVTMKARHEEDRIRNAALEERVKLLESKDDVHNIIDEIRGFEHSHEAVNVLREMLGKLNSQLNGEEYEEDVPVYNEDADDEYYDPEPEEEEDLRDLLSDDEYDEIMKQQKKTT